jgi:hypothetical protein
MASAYVPPETISTEKRRLGQKATVAGAVLAGLGVIGIGLSTILKVVWLGILGGPIGALSWLALIIGAGLFIYGFLQIKAARESRSL